MDKELYQLEQLIALGDIEARQNYVVTLIHSGIINEIELAARLNRNQRAIGLFLEALNLWGQINLQNLWLCPFVSSSVQGNDISDFQGSYPFWPYDSPFTPPLKFDIELFYKFCSPSEEDHNTYLDYIGEYYVSLGFEYTRNSLRGAYLVDIHDLETADNIKDHQNYLELSENYPINVDTRQINIARLEDRVLLLNSILILNNWAFHFPEFHELGLHRRIVKPSFKYFEEQRRRRWMEVPASIREPLSIKEVRTWWPHRLVKQLPSYISIEGQRNEPYVLVIHRPTLRGFSLDRGYMLLKSQLSFEEILDASRYNVQRDEGWLPSSTDQLPLWAQTQYLPREEFTAYWVAD